MAIKIKDIKLYLSFLKYIFRYKLLIIILLLSIVGYAIFNGASIALIKPLIDDVFFKSHLENNQFELRPNLIKLKEKNIRYLPGSVKSFILEKVNKINRYFYKNYRKIPFKKLLKIIAIAIFITILLKLICLFIRNYLTQYIGNKAIINIRGDTYKNILNLSFGFFDKNKTGELISVLINDTNALLTSIIIGISDSIFYFFQIFIFIFILFYIDFDLSFISIGIILVLLVPMLNISKRLRKRGYLLQERWADIMIVMQEALSGINVIKSFGTEKYEVDKSNKANYELFKQTLKTYKYIILASPITEIAGALAAITILVIGSNKIINQVINPGDFILFLTALLSTLSPLKRMADAFSNIIKSIGAADRVNKFLQLKSSIVEKENAILLDKFEKQIEFRNADFAYENDNYVIKNFNLKISKGEIVALVGKSGSGKTTALHLIPRFYDVQEGDIIIDNLNIKDVKLKSLTELVSIVSQETFLFNETVKYNISYGMEDAADNDIINAAKSANAHDFIMELENGYDTIVGERGVMLSGGQKQRISIARALLKNSPILLLDEATSALDTESEILVQKALEKLMHNRTTVVVAHRLSTIINSDKIVVLEEGEIKEIGTHKELLAKGGLYKKFYDLQFNL